MADENRARWTKLVADFESCDLSQREFAEERGLSLSNLRYWLYLLRKESRQARPVLERVVADARAGKVRAVAFWALDRAGRTMQGAVASSTSRRWFSTVCRSVLTLK
jgi:hypothetical protein